MLSYLKGRGFVSPYWFCLIGINERMNEPRTLKHLNLPKNVCFSLWPRSVAKCCFGFLVIDGTSPGSAESKITTTWAHSKEIRDRSARYFGWIEKSGVQSCKIFVSYLLIMVKFSSMKIKTHWLALEQNMYIRLLFLVLIAYLLENKYLKSLKWIMDTRW